MGNEFKVLPRWVIYLFLWIGLLAGIAIRSLTILNRVDPALAVWVWRFAMICYTLFFGYRYVITTRRRRIIQHHGLVEAAKKAHEFDPDQRDALVYVLRSITRSKELFNYVFICLLSIVALVLDFVLG